MARKHARIFVSIWDDPDFTALDPASQVLYFAILSSRDLSWCGVHPLLPQRFTGISAGLNERRIRSELGKLSDALFLVIDNETAEMAVRTYVRHDGVLDQPNVTKAMGRAFGLVRSRMIQRNIVLQLARALREEPGAKGWHALQSAYPELFQQIGEKALPNPSRNPSANPSTKAS